MHQNYNQFPLLLSLILNASGLMCLLMFHVTEIDGAEGQWVAQLCGCKASSPLSACQKTEACQPLYVCHLLCVCVRILVCVYLCASIVCKCWCVSVWHGDSLVRCQQLSVSHVSSRCDTCWLRTRTGCCGNGLDGWWRLGVCVYMFVCVYNCVKTNAQYHTCTTSLCIYDCLSRHLCVHECIRRMRM